MKGISWSNLLEGLSILKSYSPNTPYLVCAPNPERLDKRDLGRLIELGLFDINKGDYNSISFSCKPSII